MLKFLQHPTMIIILDVIILFLYVIAGERSGGSNTDAQ